MTLKGVCQQVFHASSVRVVLRGECLKDSFVSFLSFSLTLFLPLFLSPTLRVLTNGDYVLILWRVGLVYYYSMYSGGGSHAFTKVDIMEGDLMLSLQYPFLPKQAIFLKIPPLHAYS